jgi:molecular chaperone GrpE
MSELEPEVVVGEIVEESPGPPGIDLPEDKDEALSVLLGQLAESQEEATSYLDDLRRVAADFDNFRKRALREQSATVDRAAERVVRGLLPVLDSFDAALAAEPVTDGERRLLSGMIGTREQLLKALEQEGLEVIPTIGEPFDPEIHEPAGMPEGNGPFVVAQELRRGYRLGGKVLRAALVALESQQ